ncbi:MAG: hypothetical protein K9M82_01650 [Deltaproteobacteria bacterium]|nr:hypothetical protein [Deltaproteobacteria bacterium]
MQNPGVRKQVEEMLAGHWEDWVHEKLPALGGLSPEEALLLDAKRGRSRDSLTAEANRKGARRARELLGL